MESVLWTMDGEPTNWGQIELLKTESTKRPSQMLRAIALHSISWVVENASTLPQPVREKLSVPLDSLPSALASLTPLELLELKKIIVRLDSTDGLRGPLDSNELCDFLNSIAERALTVKNPQKRSAI